MGSSITKAIYLLSILMGAILIFCYPVYCANNDSDRAPVSINTHNHNVTQYGALETLLRSSQNGNTVKHDLINITLGAVALPNMSLVVSRKQRDVNCGDPDDLAPLCPWTQSFFTNFDLVPERVAIYNCTQLSLAGTTLACRPIYREKSFRRKNCNTDDCEKIIYLPIGCYAAYPCSEPAGK